MCADQTGRSDLPRGKRRTRARIAAQWARRAHPHSGSPRDRGTILLMVLGVLALMAIIMVVYAAIGKSDRATSAAQVRTRRVDDQVDSFARYLADVIGDDVFATYAQEDDRDANTTNTLPIDPRLEAADIPDTDGMMVSQRDSEEVEWQNRQVAGYYGFNPQGSYSKSWRDLSQAGGGNRAIRRDPRGPSDPFLSATEPIFRNRHSADWNWRAFGYSTGQPPWDYNGGGEDYMNLRDWGHISNFAPSGNFVNLWALRNNFRAKPGFRTQADFNAGDTQSGLSELLSTIDPATGYSYPININQRTNFVRSGELYQLDRSLPGPIRSGGNLNRGVHLNRPADWTVDQIGAFRTTSELRPGNAANEAPYGLDDPEFMPYQWVDADGDGFYDSRWIELVDIFDPENPRSVVGNTSRARYFLGVRAVDLTALVNVNTASDFNFQPRRNYVFSRPADAQPADVLRPLDRPRLVRNTNGAPIAGANLPPRLQSPPLREVDLNPNDPFGANDWVDYRRAVQSSHQIPAGLTPADVDLARLLRLSDAFYAFDVNGLGAGYVNLPQPPVAGGDPLAGDYRAYDPDNDFRNIVIGNAAYQAIWQSRQAALPEDRRFSDPDEPDPLTGEPPFIDTLRSANQRFAYYDNLGRRRDPARQRDTGLLNHYGLTFDEADELELRTFQGVNDPDRTSRLETTVAGRYDLDPDLYTLSPLRDNRSAALERAGRDLAPRDLASGPNPGPNDPYRKALLASQLDIRRLLTTISGSRPIIDNLVVTLKTDRNGDVVNGSPRELSELAGTLRVDGSRLVSTIVETTNHSFHKNLNDRGPDRSDPCEWFDLLYDRPVPISTDPSRNVRNYVLANIARENTFDDIGWFEHRAPISGAGDADNLPRPWWYQNLDNRPDPPRLVLATPPQPPPNEPDPIEPPVGSIYSDATRPPDSENFNTSRLELMREAFRAYAACLLPYTQWGADPTRPSDVNGPFPDAWTIEPNFSSNPYTFDVNAPVHRNFSLAYGGDPELAYRMAAHMAVNLRDAIDSDRRVEVIADPSSRLNTIMRVTDDHKQSAVSLDLTQQSMINYTNNPQPTGRDPLAIGSPPIPSDPRFWWTGNVNGSYQRDRNYPWPKLNLDDRTTTTDDRAARTRMPRDPRMVTSTGHQPGDPNKQVNIFGIEPQPFISQVTAMAMFADSPNSPTYTPSGDDDECVPGWVQDSSAPGGQRRETCDEAAARLAAAGQEACRVTVSLVRRIDGTDASSNNSDFLCYLIAFQVTNPFDTDIVLEPEDPSTNDSWYYVEYANRFYRLCPQDYRQPYDGLRRNLTESQRILKPGETRVYYSTYPNSLKDISVRLNRQRWAQFEWTGNGTAPTEQTAPTSPEAMGEDADREIEPALIEPVIERMLKHEFGETCIHVAPMYPETGRAIGAAQSGRFGDRTSVPDNHRLGNSVNVTDPSDPRRSIDLFAISKEASHDVEALADGPDFENTEIAGSNPDRRRRLLDDLPEIKLSSNGPTWTQADKIMVESDPRRRILLWRVMRDPDFVDGGPEDIDPQLIARGVGDPNGVLKPNWIGNDLLLDRLYDPAPVPVLAADRPLRNAAGAAVLLTPEEQQEVVRSANGSLVQALIAPFKRRLDLLNVPPNQTNSHVSIAETDTCIQDGATRGPDDTGFTLVSWVSITRPTNPPRPPASDSDLLGNDPVGVSPVGALPPWCMEVKPDNVFEPGFTRYFTPNLADGNSGMTIDDERRSPSLNRVRKSCGLKKGPLYRDQSVNSTSTYYRRFREMLDVHAATPPAGEFFDSAFLLYPSDYQNGNQFASTTAKFVDNEMATRFADRRGARNLRPYVNMGSTPTFNSPKGDVRETINMVEIDLRRSADGGETDEFFNRTGAGRTGMKPRRFDEVAIEIHRLPTDATDSANPQPTGSRALFSRVGDFLLPLAIGPSFDPAAGYTVRRPEYGQGAVPDSIDPLNPVSPPGTNPDNPDPQVSGPAELRFARRMAMLDNQWTTLAEAIATAADYYSGPRVRENIKWTSPDSSASSAPVRQQVNQRNIFYRFARDTRFEIDRLSETELTDAEKADVIVPKGDRGHLVLDAWSPYLDYNPGNIPTARAYVWGRLDPTDGEHYNASNAVNADAPLGNGIPLALNVLDKFRVAGMPGETRAKPNDIRLCTRRTGNPPRPLATVGNQFALSGRTNAYGSASTIERGKININTAPLAVLRLLPMLSPSRDHIDTSLNNVLDSWLYDERHLTGADVDTEGLSLITRRQISPLLYIPGNALSPNPPTPRRPAIALWDPDESGVNDRQPWDIATTFDAYRWQIALDTRRVNDTADPMLVNYRDDRLGTGGSGPTRSGRDDSFMISAESDRQGGLRDRNGFKSVGEVMATVIKRSTIDELRLRNEGINTNYGFPARMPIDAENSITRLAHDGASNRSLAIDSVGYAQSQVRYDLTPQGRTTAAMGMPSAVRPNRAAGDFRPSEVVLDMPVVGLDGLVDNNGNRIVTDGLVEGSDTIVDDYDEKLSIANAILNTITVRSDIFGVWFVIHGYTAEDTLVDDGFPMVPSVAKRYFMVVDRSNVTTPTTKPKILMLRELPSP